MIKEFEPDEDDSSLTARPSKAFENEKDFYANLENLPVENLHHYFLRYYGAFVVKGRGFIILEYADQGSLQDFLKQNNLPYSHQELQELWSRLSDLFLGLAIIHNLHDSGDHGGTIRAIHQDFKPANIFVFREGQGTSYSYRFKIGDFGMSCTILEKRKRHSTDAVDSQGTRMYAAPELTHHQPALDYLNFRASPAVDVWSLGCVLSEVLVWTICGHRGREDFLKFRQEATDEVCSRHKSQGYSGCFHDGNHRIEAVDRMIEYAVTNRRIFDNITGRIGRFLCDQILRPKDRLDAQTAKSRLEDILNENPGHRHPTRGNTICSVDRLSVYQISELRGSNDQLPTHPRQDTTNGFGLPHGTGHSDTSAIDSLSQENRMSTTTINPFGAMNPYSNPRMPHNGRSTAHMQRSMNPRVVSAPVIPSAPEHTYEPHGGFEPNHGEISEEVIILSPLDSIARSPTSDFQQPSSLARSASAISETLRPAPRIQRSATRVSKTAVKFEIVTISQVLEWIGKKKRSSESRLAPPPPKQLPDYGNVMNIIRNREQVCHAWMSSSPT